MKRTPLARRTPLRRTSRRRAHELRLYGARCAQFLVEHPYCQLWLREHGLDEVQVIAAHGVATDPMNQRRVRVPCATAVHHTNKRRGSRLLDEREWMAVSARGHRRIEADKAWARARGYLRDF